MFCHTVDNSKAYDNLLTWDITINTIIVNFFMSLKQITKTQMQNKIYFHHIYKFFCS